MLIFYSVILGGVFIYLIIEYALSMNRIRRVPLRILVNGTRGKSATVQIMHAIFLSAGMQCYARTTGDRVCIHQPDGTLQIRKRHAPANIIENIRILYRWTRSKPQAIIMECMAIRPESQFAVSRILQPTHIVFTNILTDHLEHMGQNIDQIRDTLSNCILPGAHLTIPDTEKKYLSMYDKNGSQTEIFKSHSFRFKFDNIPQPIIDDCWGLILCLCNTFKISEKIAEVVFRRFWESENRRIYIENIECKYTFINLFSVNDVQSTQLFLNHFRSSDLSVAKRAIILNTRNDRPLRTREFLCMIDELVPAQDIWLVGTGRILARKMAKGLNSAHNFSTKSIQDVIEQIREGFQQPVIIFGLANHKGIDPLIDVISRTNSL